MHICGFMGSVITDLNVVWSGKIKDPTLQEGLNKKSNCRFFTIAQPAES
jgi:hypothetical protein